MKTNVSANNFTQKNLCYVGAQASLRWGKKCALCPEIHILDRRILWAVPRPQSIFPNTNQPARNSLSKIFSSLIVVVSFVRVYFNLFYFCYSPCREAKTSREKILH